MTQEHDVGVTVFVTISGPRHCGNSCRFMRDAKAEIRDKRGLVFYKAEPTSCVLGLDPAVLTWDKRRKTFGYRRTRYCRENEQ